MEQAQETVVVEYVPYKTIVKDDEGNVTKEYEPEFEGSAQVAMLPFEERMQKLKSIRTKVKVEGSQAVVEKNDSVDDYIDQAVNLYRVAAPQVVSMNLIHKKTKKVFTSLKQLEIYSAGKTVIAQIGNLVLDGATLGEG